MGSVRHMRGPAAKPSRHRGRSLTLALGIALYLVGAGVFLYPAVGGWLAQQESMRNAEQALAQDVSDTPAEEGAAPGKRAKDGDAAYSYLLEYNKRVVDGTAGPVSDPWDTEAGSEQLASIGLADQIIGSISIPRLGETIPIYLGATSEHLAEGAALVEGTSAPLGQIGSNSVIAAHRGQWRGLPMFRDIEDMELGDLLTVETPWDTMTYKVVEFKIITPYDTAAVRPQEGRDLVTLLTCHPYGHNYQRYLVFCERVDTQEPVRADDGLVASVARPALSVLEPSDSPVLAAERWLRLAGLVVLIAAPVVFAARALVRRSRR